MDVNGVFAGHGFNVGLGGRVVFFGGSEIDGQKDNETERRNDKVTEDREKRRDQAGPDGTTRERARCNQAGPDGTRRGQM